MGKYLVYTWYVWLLNVYGHSEVIRCILIFPVFDNIVSRKRLVVERNRPKFSLYRVLWQLSVQGQSEVFKYICDLRQTCVSKMAGLRAKQTKIWASEGKSLAYTGYV